MMGHFCNNTPTSTEHTVYKVGVIIRTHATPDDRIIVVSK